MIDADGKETTCPKCGYGYGSGNDWRQCKGACPIVGSPHYRAHDPHAVRPARPRPGVTVPSYTVVTIGEWAISEVPGDPSAMDLASPFGAGQWVFRNQTDPNDPQHVMACLLRMLVRQIPQMEEARRKLLQEVAQTAQEGLQLAAAALRAEPPADLAAEAEFEIRELVGDDEEPYASTSGPREAALIEAQRYAAQLGPAAIIYEVTRRRITP